MAMSSLILQHPEWSDGDYDVLADGVVVGRIMKASAPPEGTPWLWTLIFRLPRGSHTDTRFRQKLHLPPCPDFRDRLYGRLFCNMPVRACLTGISGGPL
jgi:hypothetical protein